MATPTSEDEMLLILLRNLRNAAATFGEGSIPYKGIRITVQEHLHEMKTKGLTTNLTKAREQGLAGYQKPPTLAEEAEARDLSGLLESLALEKEKSRSNG